MVHYRRAMLIALASMALLGSGCRTQGPGRFGPRRLDRPIRLSVENNNFLDVTVYAVAGGLNLKLGEVTGKSSGSFSIDPRKINLNSGLRLRVDPLGSNRYYLSPALFVDSRVSVFLGVAAELEFSFVTLR